MINKRSDAIGSDIGVLYDIQFDLIRVEHHIHGDCSNIANISRGNRRSDKVNTIYLSGIHFVINGKISQRALRKILRRESSNI